MTLKKFLISGAICSLLMSSNYALAQTTTATSSTTTAAVEATISWLKTLYWQVTDLIATIENLKTTKTRSANNKNTSSLGSDGNNNGSRNLNNSNSGRQGSGNIVSPNSNPAGTGSGGGSSNPLTSRNSDVYRGTGLTEKPTTDTREIPPEPKTDQPESDTARDGAGPRGAIQKDSVPAEAQGERTSKIDTIVLHATFSDIDGKNKGAREDDTQKIKQEWKDSGRKLSAHYIINK
ncbi:MAG: hypothetical protein WCO03_00965, partial [bacterium]